MIHDLAGRCATSRGHHYAPISEATSARFNVTHPASSMRLGSLHAGSASGHSAARAQCQTSRQRVAGTGAASGITTRKRGAVEHARDIARLLPWEFRIPATVVTSDDPTASERIASFAAGTSEWLVAVRMVSEGVDIPRLRVGVYATATMTDLFFHQAVGRFVRWQDGIRNQRAWLCVPDDPRVRAWAGLIT